MNDFGQRTTRVTLVLGELPNERVRRCKAHRIAKSIDELDAHALAVELVVCVEQVDLECNIGFVERRTRTEVHHPAERATRRIDGDSIYPVWREEFTGGRGLDVDRRVAEETAPLRAGD